MAEFLNEIELWTESGELLIVDLRNALIRSAAPDASTKARQGMQCYVVSGSKIEAEYICTAVSGTRYTWVKHEVSGGGADVATITEAMILTDTASDGTETHKLALIRSDGTEIVVTLPEMGIALSDVVVVKTTDPTSNSSGNTGMIWVNKTTAKLWVCTSGGNVSSTSWLQISGTSGGTAAADNTADFDYGAAYEDVSASVEAGKHVRIKYYDAEAEETIYAPLSYILPTANGDVYVFGAAWDDGITGLWCRPNGTWAVSQKLLRSSMGSTPSDDRILTEKAVHDYVLEEIAGLEDKIQTGENSAGSLSQFVWKKFDGDPNNPVLTDGTDVLYIAKRGYPTDNRTTVYYSDAISTGLDGVSLADPIEIDIPVTSDGATTASVLKGKYVTLGSKDDVYFIPSDARIIMAGSAPMYDIRATTYQTVEGAEFLGFVTAETSDAYPANGVDSTDGCWYVGGGLIGDITDIDNKQPKGDYLTPDDIDETLSIPGAAADAAVVGEKVAELSKAIDELKEAAGGLNSASAELLITILRSAVYDTDQSANIDALETALSEGGADTPVEPDEPSVETLSLAVVIGAITRVDGVKLTYDTTSASANIRASINPIAVYVESGKTYKIALPDYSTYGINMQTYTYPVKDTDFTVVGGTQRIINGDFVRTYTSGWKHEDISYNADGTADLMIVQFAKGSANNETFTTDDITALNGMLTVTVE